MKKEFCTYEQSRALKELGFDSKSVDRFGCYFPSTQKLDSHYFSTVYLNDKEATPAPLIQQAFRFFREKYDYYPTIEPRYLHSEIIADLFTPTVKKHIGIFNTYEEAEQACLNKLIQLVKEKR